MRDAIEVRLQLEKATLRWKASIEGEVYGVHKYEQRAVDRALCRYAAIQGIDLDSAEHSVVYGWPRSILQLQALFESSEKEHARSKAKLEAAKRAFVKAKKKARIQKEAHLLLTSQYVAALLQYGLSTQSALSMTKMVNNTVQKYIRLQGGVKAAASRLLQRVAKEEPAELSSS